MSQEGTDHRPDEELDDDGGMLTEDEETVDPSDLGAPVSSILDRVVAERDEALGEATVKIEIPSWEGAMVAEYRLLKRKTVEKMGRKSARGDVGADMDFLARACIGIYARDPDTDKLIPLRIGGDSADEGTPLVRYTSDLMELLGKSEINQPHAIIRYMMQNNDVAIGTHAARVFQWMTDTSADVPGEVEGN